MILKKNNNKELLKSYMCPWTDLSDNFEILFCIGLQKRKKSTTASESVKYSDPTDLSQSFYNNLD